jgi:hypothetical protein
MELHFIGPRPWLMQNVAVVKIEMASKFVTRAVRDQRVTFVDQLSSLGALGINVAIAIFGNFLVCMYVCMRIPLVGLCRA